MSDRVELATLVHQVRCGCGDVANLPSVFPIDFRVADYLLEAGWKSPGAWKDAIEANAAWVKKNEELDGFRQTVAVALEKLS